MQIRWSDDVTVTVDSEIADAIPADTLVEIAQSLRVTDPALAPDLTGNQVALCAIDLNCG